MWSRGSGSFRRMRSRLGIWIFDGAGALSAAASRPEHGASRRLLGQSSSLRSCGTRRGETRRAPASLERLRGGGGMTAELPIALDAMGGDNAPREIVRGALLGAARLGVSVALVGRREEVERELAAAVAADGVTPEARERVSVVDAAEVI